MGWAYYLITGILLVRVTKQSYKNKDKLWFTWFVITDLLFVLYILYDIYSMELIPYVLLT